MTDLPNIDEIDHRILLELQADARRSNKALAASVGLAPSTTLGRVRDLEAGRIILGYHAVVDPAALGRSIQALVSVRLQPKTNVVVEEFVEMIWELEETIAVTMLTGPFDLLVHLSVADISGLQTLVLERIASFDGVVDEQTSIIFEHRRKNILTGLRAAG